jgi:hypothetical protein
VLITLAELTGAVKWIHNPDAICAQPRLVICSLLREDRVIGKCRAELISDQRVRTLITFAAEISRVECRCRTRFSAQLQQQGTRRICDSACLCRAHSAFWT